MSRKKKTTLELVKEALEKEIEELPNLTFMHLDCLDSATEYCRGIRTYLNQLHQRVNRYVTSQISWTIRDDDERN